MKLTLINDIPLFSTPNHPRRFDQLVRNSVAAIDSDLPASTSYIGFPELVQTWRKTVVGVKADVIALIGTRPPLLTTLIPKTIMTGIPIRIVTSREHDPNGHTARVRILRSNNPSALRQAHHVLVADDVAMSAATISAVLSWEEIATADHTVRIGYATTSASQRLRSQHPTADIATVHALNFAPITEGTVIFLASLFFGTLRDRPFLHQHDLLRPFFGEDLRPLYTLRDLVQRLLPHPPVLLPPKVPTDGNP